MAIEIERKFLVTDDSYRAIAFHSDKIVQGYLCRQNGNSVRVRIRGNKGFLTIKGPSQNGGISRYEWEKEISVTDAKELLLLCGKAKIEKTRYLIRYGEHTFEIDEFYGDNEGLVVAEVELSAIDETFEKPPFLGNEVTGQTRYYNSHLTIFPYKEW